MLFAIFLKRLKHFFVIDLITKIMVQLCDLRLQFDIDIKEFKI